MQMNNQRLRLYRFSLALFALGVFGLEPTWANGESTTQKKVALHQLPARGHINIATARKLYLEGKTITSTGPNFFTHCQETGLEQHKLMPINTVPFLNYKAIPIFASPYFSTWEQKGKNNNTKYINRLVQAIDVIQKNDPELFAKLQITFSDHNGYVIADNFCPKDGALAFGGFAPIGENAFVVMISTTMLLRDDLFSEYDIASIIVHEGIGHGHAFYTSGDLSEVTAFRAQAEFTRQFSPEKFKNPDNRAENLWAKIKFSLSPKGTYVSK